MIPAHEMWSKKARKFWEPMTLRQRRAMRRHKPFNARMDTDSGVLRIKYKSAGKIYVMAVRR